MKQVVQHLRTGRVKTVEVPIPDPGMSAVLVESRASVISSGTERSKVQAGQSSLLKMARSRPDQVQKVLAVAKQQGLSEAARRVLSRLDEYSPLGYSAAGVVCGGGLANANVRAGDRVACAGGEWAWHAEYLVISPRLLAPVPDSVSDEEAAFAAVASIALHSVHQAGVGLGERVVVVGLGLVGQIALQLVHAAGAETFGVDPVAARGALGRTLVPGASIYSTLAEIERHAGGVDHVLVTAATSDPSLLNECVEVIRDRGVITVVGDVPIQLDRRAFYAKEAELRIARSYGPGRHLRQYEIHGQDLPVPYVRWSIERNLREVLRLMERGQLDVKALITDRYPIDAAEEAYERLVEKGDNAPLAIVLEYPGASGRGDRRPSREIKRTTAPRQSASLGVGVIGAGAFAQNVAIPSLQRTARTELVGITSARGLSAARAAERFHFGRVYENAHALLSDDAVDAVVILTQHDTHGDLVLRALAEGKHVFVEKPLTLDPSQLDLIRTTARTGQILAVGYNRRHSRHARAVRELVSSRGGTMMATHRFNAGGLPDDHWVHDVKVGGGRIIGELCHAVDTLQYLADARIVSVASSGVPRMLPAGEHEDNLVVTLQFENGSVGTIVYTSLGDARSGKERVEVYCGGATGIIEDFQLTRLVRDGRTRKVRSRDKGHREQFEAFVRAARGEIESPWILDELIEVSRATFSARESLRLLESLDVG